MSFTKIGKYWKGQLQYLVDNNYTTNVFNYVPKEVKTGPLVCIFPQDGNEEYFDNTTNENNYPFMIKVINNNISNEEEAEEDMREIVDKTLEIIRKNDIYNYDGIQVHRGGFSYVWGWNDDQYKSRVCDITINNFILNNIN